MSEINISVEWSSLVSDIKNCKKCVMSATKHNYVVCDIDWNNCKVFAPILFVGEAPGLAEDKTGLPFQGSAGHTLHEQIKRIGLHRWEYTIINTIKCRPITNERNNRTPTKEEVMNCSFFLVRQYHILKPKVVVLLGKVAERAWDEYIHDNVKVMRFFHPAYLIYRKEKKEEFEQQFDNLKNEVLRLRNTVGIGDGK